MPNNSSRLGLKNLLRLARRKRMNDAMTTAPAPITPATIPPIAPPEMEASLELEETEVLLCVAAVDADGDIVVTTTCVVGMTDGTVYTVEVMLVLCGGGGGT